MEEKAFIQLKNVLNNLLTITEAEYQEISKVFRMQSVPAKTVLVSEGQVADELYFITNGLMRLFYTTDSGNEITGFIFSENMFAASLESFLVQQVSLQTLETLEKTELLILSRKDLMLLYEQVPISNIIMRKVMEQRFVASQQILSSYILYKPEERYLQFTQKFPSLLQRVPQHIIASFLGITPVSLSRIRNRTVKSS